MIAADEGHMRHALALARRGVGRTAPNPAVGCVLVDGQGRVIARGWTQPGGRPHAEAMALAAAGPAARGATAYVTLEPCSHTGRTPPCADGLIAAGIARCVVATGDPDPRVAGRGLARMRAAGIAVETGLLAAEARLVAEGFLSRVERGRPHVTLKLATSLDGRIATGTGLSQWITGPAARAAGQRLRAEADAIVTGIGTVLADDPALTVRLPGLEDRSPLRVVMDRWARLPPTAKMLTGGPPVLLATGVPADGARALLAAGVGLLPLPDDPAAQPAALLSALAERGVTRVLIEAGQGIATAFLKADLVDRLIWFRAAGLIGGDGLPPIGALGIDAPGAMLRFRRTPGRMVGDDQMECYDRLTDPPP